MFKNYLKSMLRNLWKNKTYSLLNILGLAIGITCAGLIFLWVEDELNWDNNNVKKTQLYQLEVNKVLDGNNITMGSTPRPMAKAIQAEIPGIVNTARYTDFLGRLLFSFDDKSLYASGGYADASLFSMFTFHFVQGNSKNPFPQLYSLVITESTAKKFIGQEKNIIGKTIRIDNKQDYVVSAVVKDMPENSTLQFEWLAPSDVLGSTQDWGSYGPFNTYVELDKNANLESINKQLKDFIHHKAPYETTKSFLYPMSQWHLHNEFANGKPTGGGAITQVRLLSAIAWIILLIACINFMNLATANSQKRAREIGVRKVLGAGKKKLIIQFIGEALFMSAIAAIYAVVIISVSLPAFNSLTQKQLELQLVNPAHIAALLLNIIICGLVAGSYPSIYLSSFNPVFVLKGLKMKRGSAALIRKGLVVFQFTISIVFVISTVIVYLQIQHIKNRNLGFDKNNLIEVNPENDISKIFPLIKNNLLSTGSIQGVALADNPILNGNNTDDRFKWQGSSSDNRIGIAYRNVSPEFITVSGMKIIDGRNFSTNISSESSNVIINQSMAKLMDKGSVVGKIIQSPRGNSKGVYTNMTVIGVVSDYIYGNIYNGKTDPVIIFCKPPENPDLLYIRMKARSDVENTLSKIKEVMRKNNPAYPLEYKFVDGQFNEMFSNETHVSRVSGIFAALAIIISCLGLFGLTTYTAERRVKEIGVRKVLGASVVGIATLLAKDFLQLVAIACLIAFPAAWQIMHGWLQNYEYRIDISWWIFLVAGVSAILIALITISFRSIKAAMANPVKSLRME
jgi:ABC-type antimicrobial peptide transport system permease subunit